MISHHLSSPFHTSIPVSSPTTLPRAIPSVFALISHLWINEPRTRSFF